VTSFRTRTPSAGAGSTPAAPALGATAPIGQWAFAGVALTSLGGPLALAALYAPGIAAGATSSAGLAMVAAAVAFGFPLAIWLSYGRHVSGPGGLYSFTEAAAGRRIALVQAGVWTLSYLLYLLYTTAQIVYDELPLVISGEKRYQAPLAIAIPVVIAGVMVAGRRATLLVTFLLGFGQLALAAVLGGVTISGIGMEASSFGASAPAGSLAIASGQTALLYICGSLPLFLGGEVGGSPGGPRGSAGGSPGSAGGSAGGGVRVVRRGLIGAYLATVVVIIAAVAPLSAVPGFTRTAIPGMAVAGAFGGHGLAVAVGVGVAASIGGVMLVEYLALSRLAVAVTGWPVQRVILGIAAGMVVFAPVLLINPDAIYNALLKPSLAALWLSQLIVFAVYPRFAVRHGQRAVPAWILAAAGSAFAVYGLVAAIQNSST